MSAVDPIQSGQAVQTMVQDQQQKGHAAQQTSATDQKRPIKDSVSVDVPPSTKSLEKLESVTGEMTQVAQQVRATDTALKQNQALVEQMKKELEKIIKNYPPFPIDSSERKDILMSYSAIRQEILKLTIPSPPDPVYVAQPSLWDSLTSPGAFDATIPDLQVASQDRQVTGAQDGLNAVGTALQNGREALAKSSQL